MLNNLYMLHQVLRIPVSRGFPGLGYLTTDQVEMRVYHHHEQDLSALLQFSARDIFVARWILGRFVDAA